MQSKQEEIREGLERIGREHVGGSWFTVYADEILTYLHSQNVAIKVEGELPEAPKEVNDLVEGWRPMKLEELSCFKGAIKWMLKAGYTAWEPLIGDE